MQRVTIAGAGNVGYALAFHLSHLGMEVAIYVHPDFEDSLEPISTMHEIEAVAEEAGFRAVLSGNAPIALATNNAKAAAEFGKVIIFVVPAFGQLPMFELFLPYLKDTHLLVNIPGNFAALAYTQYVKDKNCEKKLQFADTDSSPYACRKVGGNRVFISGVKKLLHVGVFPSENSNAVIDQLKPVLPVKLVAMENALEVGFRNINMVIHPPPVLHNVGWIEVTGGQFSFYRDGCSPSVCKVMDRIDEERMGVAKALKLNVQPFINIDKEWYGDSGKQTSYEHIHYGAFHAFFAAPPSLQTRFIEEDVVYGLMPVLELAKRHNIPTPVLNAMITLLEVLLEKKLEAKRSFDFFVQTGESVEDMHKRLATWEPS